ncbi:MAG: TonB-dependent receptor [Fibrobacter sp.]|nr:TonB-dependent receptor [Fibrobacter sp.]
MIIPDNYNTFMYDKISFIPGTVAPYAEMQYTPLPGLLLVSGLRFDYYPELGYNGSILPEFWNYSNVKNRNGISGEPSVRFSARYEIDGRHTVKGSLGTYNQTPQPIGLSTHKTFGNPSAPASKARQITLGYEWKITDLVYADIHLYHNNQWDVPEYGVISDPLLMLSGGEIYDNGKGRMYGMELMVRHDQGGKMFWWASYSLSRSERYCRNENRWALYDSDQTHNLQVMFSYRLLKEWQVGSRFRLISGNPYSPISRSVYNTTRRLYIPEYGKKNSERNRPFCGLDIRVDKKFIFDNWMMSAYLDLQNITWLVYKSPEMVLYNFDYTKKYEISTPFIPSLGLRFEF